MKDASHPRRRYPRPMKATPRLLGLAVSSVGAILVPAFTTVAQAQVGSTPAPLVQSTFSLVEPFDAVAFCLMVSAASLHLNPHLTLACHLATC